MRIPSMLATVAVLTALGSAAVFSGPAPSPDETLIEYWRAHPRSPLDYVVDKFADNKWVFLGEYHRIRHDVDRRLPELD